MRTLPRAMLLVALVVPVASLFAQAGRLAGQLPPVTAEQIDAAVAQALKDSSTPSISIPAVQEGKIANPNFSPRRGRAGFPMETIANPALPTSGRKAAERGEKFGLMIAPSSSAWQFPLSSLILISRCGNGSVP
jgi:hypothetical protein